MREGVARCDTHQVGYAHWMETVTLSEDFQVTIPAAMRESLGLEPGITMKVVQKPGRIEFIPVRHPSELRGFLHGIDTTVDRDDAVRP